MQAGDRNHPYQPALSGQIVPDDQEGIDVLLPLSGLLPHPENAVLSAHFERKAVSGQRAGLCCHVHPVHPFSPVVAAIVVNPAVAEWTACCPVVPERGPCYPDKDSECCRELVEVMWSPEVVIKLGMTNRNIAYLLPTSFDTPGSTRSLVPAFPARLPVAASAGRPIAGYWRALIP
jgi:hypothetical protein